MTQEHAAQLLERFYAGTSSVDEERALRDFLTSEACPPAWTADREVVLAMSVPEEVEVPEGLEARIAARLRPRRRPHFYLTHRLSAVAGIVAAAAAVFVCIYVWHRPSPTVYADTCTTPQQAAIEVCNTLVYVSEDLARGLESEEELGGPCP